MEVIDIKTDLLENEKSIKSNQKTAGISGRLVFFLALACGSIVANLYYAQPLVGIISQAVGLDAGSAGLVVSLTQFGYCFGVLLLVPLGDLLENRKLIITLIFICAVASLIAAFSAGTAIFLAATFLIGLSASTTQIIVPYGASLADDLSRGRIIGNIVSGTMIGIMIARPLASFLTHFLGWHAIYFVSAAVMIFVGCLFIYQLPERKPQNSALNYRRILISMIKLLVQTRVLQRRSAYQALLFGAFIMFWTTVPLLLANEFHLSQIGIALFAFVGIAGAATAPLAGRLADRGLEVQATGAAMLLVLVSYLLMLMVSDGSSLNLGILVLCAILLDAGIITALILGQKAIFSLEAASRNRLNALFVAIIFLGGAVSSFFGTWIYANEGWKMTAAGGVALPILALLLFATEFLPSGSKTESAMLKRSGADLTKQNG